LGRQNAAGWHAVRCAVCHDHSERAAFKFDSIYAGASCFNCGIKFRYEEGSGKLSRDAKLILQAFGITTQELDKITSSAFFNKAPVEKDITVESLKPKLQLFTPVIELPPKSHLLGSPFSEELQVPLIEYITGRALDPLELNAHFSLDKKFLGRVILPCMRDGKVIYWQARTVISGDTRARYLSPPVNKDAVMWGYDNIWRRSDEPLFITEGIFDAASINGVALLGSTLNEAKLEVLNKCKRRKIVVVDRDSNGGALAVLALQNGWEITFPPKGVEDVNGSVRKFGRLVTIWTLLKEATVPTGLKTADGLGVQSKLNLGMELMLANLSRRK